MIRTTIATALGLVLAATATMASTEGAWILDDGQLYTQTSAADSQDYDRNRSSYTRALEMYEKATQLLDDRDWERSAEEFERIIELNENRVDASLYWLAYSLNKLNKRAGALDAIAKLKSSSFASSRWLEDAKTLEYQIRRESGQVVEPESTDDEELKLMIINNLMHSDPDRAIPLLEKLLTQESSSTEMKKRALFVLAQGETDRGAEIIAEYARGAGDPDLQIQAIEYLGIFGSGASGDLLEGIYTSSNDTGVKRKILESFMIADDNDRLLKLARTETDARLRMKAIEQLGVNDQVDGLWTLYQSETEKDVKRKLIEAFMIADASGYLKDIARGTDESYLRLKAVEQLGILDESEMLWELYQVESQTDIRKAIMNGLWLSDDVDRLIYLAQSETDPDLRREAFQKLGLMDGVRLRKETAEMLGLSDGVRIEQAMLSFYKSETDVSAKRQLLDAMFIQDNVDGLIEIARTEPDADLRMSAIEKLGITDGVRSEQEVLSLYKSETETKIKRKLLDAMFLQDNVDALIQIVRTEKDPSLRRSAVEKLSIMDSPDATEFLIQLLED